MSINDSTEAYKLLKSSTLAIAYIEKIKEPNNQWKINWRPLGTGFIISKNKILTAGHLFDDSAVKEPTKYGIILRTINEDKPSLKNAELAMISCKGIVINRDIDSALLEFDFETEKDKFKKIDLYPIKPLPLNFDKNRNIGDSIYWMGMAINDATAIPRFFTGEIVSHYINDSRYQVNQQGGNPQNYLAKDLNMIEINHLFLPGSSGSPILSKQSEAVIGFVHGYGAWPLGLTSDKLKYPNAKVKQGSDEETIDIEMCAPVVGSLSRAIDITSTANFLKDNKVVE